MWKWILQLLPFFYVNLLFGSPFVIRSAQEEDMVYVYQLIHELAEYEGKDPTTLPISQEKLEKFSCQKHPYFFVELAEIEKEVVGYALYYFGFSAWQGNPILYLEDLYVGADYRNRGIGTALLKKLAEQAKLHDCCRMEWHVFDWNDSACAFYQKIGGNLRGDLLLVRLEHEALNNLLLQ